MSERAEKNENIRTRFAPSPTGFLHIGSARTALFNYLFSKRYKGVFILRIEDTNKERSNPEFEKDIIKSLSWLGIEWNEGLVPQKGMKAGKPTYIGDYGPYRQSERGEIYKRYLEKLLKENKAYYCFCAKEELEAKKQYQVSIGNVPYYNGKCAEFSQKEVERKLKQGKKCVIRLKVPIKKIEVKDMVRGKVEFDTGLFGDMIIAKDLTTPLFNFSGVVDDFEMKITHVIRGDDHLSNTPKQIIIQEALGFPRLQYGHLPLILGPDRSKLSKRHGATSISEYKKEGYLKEAMINMLAFLGWNPGDEREIYSLSALIKDFSIEKVHKSGAIFNIKKLNYLNGFYIRQKPIDKLSETCIPYLAEAKLIIPVFEEQERFPNFTGYFGKEIIQKNFLIENNQKISFDYLKKIISIYQERLKKISEIPELTDFFFRDELKYDKNLLKWKEMGDREVLFITERLIKILSEIKKEDWNSEKLEKTLLSEAEKTGIELNIKNDKGHLLWPLRVALTGKESSAGPFEIAEILGKERVLKRIETAKNLIK